MVADLGIPPGADGRVARHASGEIRPRRHRHAELELNLVVRGTASYVLGERRYELGAGSLTWLFPGQDHVLVEVSPDYELCWAVFRPALVERAAPDPTLLEADPVGRFSRRVIPARARDLEAVFAELLDADTALLNAGLAYLLLVAWRAFRESDDVPGVDLHPAVETVVRLLHVDPAHGPLAALARDAGLSPAHLSRLFKAQTGVSITRFRNQQRLERFFALYGRGRRTTALDAALQAGFGSYAQFYRVFRRETGRSPTALRA